MGVFQTILSNINYSLTFSVDYVNDASKIAHKITLLLLEDLWKSLIEATSNYQSKEPNPNRLFMLFSDNDTTYITELLKTQHHHTAFPPELPT